MKESVAANRYAEALFQIGKEKNILDKLVEELGLVKEVFQKNEQLDTFLKHPRVNNEEKEQFLNEMFPGMQTDVLNTMKLLVIKRRTEIIPSIINHLIQLVNDAKGIAVAKVYSVRPLSETEIEAIKLNFAKRLNKQSIQVDNIIDPSILGGLKIMIGNTVFDGSVDAKLKRLGREIVSANK